MTISPTGGDPAAGTARAVRSFKKTAGFTFLEVMVAVMVLSVGIVGVYRVFLNTLRYRSHVTYRLCAINLASDYLAVLAQQFRAGKNIPMGKSSAQTKVVIHNHDMVFGVQQEISQPGDSDALKHVELAVSWWEGERNYKILRSALIAK